MGFIELFFKKETSNVTKDDIYDFVSRKVEENLNLDYKDIRAYSDFDELSRDVSTFANSAGGLVVLGVSQQETKNEEGIVKILPKEVTWGSSSLSKEQLEDNLVGKVQPRVDGLRIVPIRENAESLRVVFLIDIPQSVNPPHMAADNKYYRRLNFRRVPMEHYEVADLFGRRKKPILTLRLAVTSVEIKDNEYGFALRFLLGNVGKGIAKHVSLSSSFANVDITNIKGDFTRIDNLRDGVPSVQFGSALVVIYPISGKWTSLGEVFFKVRDNAKPIDIKYDLIAEDAPYTVGESNFDARSLEEVKKMLETGKKPMIVTKENQNLDL